MWNKKMFWGVAVTVVAVGQIISALFFYNAMDNEALTNLGWGVMMISAIFGWLPILTFRKQGGVAKGKSYVATTQLVDTGIYAIVRHPQYLAGIIMSVALALIAPHWLVVGLGVVAVAIYAFSTFEEERGCIEKFGDEYLAYMTRVPRLNPVLGIIRALRRGRQDDARRRGHGTGAGTGTGTGKEQS